MLVMPFAVGTRSFALALIPCSALVGAASAYVVHGEYGKPRSLLGNKLLASGSITLLFAIGLVVGAVLYLAFH